MTMDGSGAGSCDGCGADLGNAGLDKCVAVTGIADGQVVTLHLCSTVPKGSRRKPCATKTLTAANLGAYAKAHKRAVPAFGRVPA